MGDFAIMNTVFSVREDTRATVRELPVSAATLSRWAAIAAERAGHAMVPHQPEAA